LLNTKILNYNILKMPIKKKSIDTLKQQKINFVNYIKTKEKYSKAI
jgi:hypothetical protein